jgi:glycosyltransferase involved in cell wall biosynthesis
LVYVKNKTEPIRLLFFGYPSNLVNYTGGRLWMKKVADNIEKNGRYCVLKICNHDYNRKTLSKIIENVYNVLLAIVKSPNIAILDAWGESNIVLWLLLRLLKPKTKIFVVFHHHEPRILFCKNFFELTYNNMIQKATEVMLKNSEIILTVSQSSETQLKTIYGILANRIKEFKNKTDKIDKKRNKYPFKRIAIVGTGIDKKIFFNNIGRAEGKKDIDFFCIGRFDKFYGLEKIWKAIKEQRADVNLVMAGVISENSIDKLYKIGIDHRGFVSEEEKIKLYSKSKVFIFPSAREGFGIAVAEALYANIPIIAWKLPVFEEFYLKKDKIKKIHLIEYGNYDLFAEECIKALSKHDTSKNTIKDNNTIFQFPTWQKVAQNVMALIDSVLK